MRHTRLYAGNSRQGGAGAIAFFDADEFGFGSDYVDTVGLDNNWGDNERLGNNYIDYNNRNDDRIYNEWIHNHRINERIDRYRRYRLNVERGSNSGCEHDDSRAGPAF